MNCSERFSIIDSYHNSFVEKSSNVDFFAFYFLSLPGHGRRLQTSICVSFPVHGLPPSAGAGFVHSLCLTQVPLSHVVLHVPQDDQLAHCPSTIMFGDVKIEKNYARHISKHKTVCFLHSLSELIYFCIITMRLLDNKESNNYPIKSFCFMCLKYE